MKRLHSMLLLASVTLCAACSGLKAGLEFGSTDSKISLAAGSRLHVSADSMTVDGTLAKNEDAAITGDNGIAFSDGVLEAQGLQATVNGTYSNDALVLAGSGRFTAQPGTVLQGISCSATGNKIEGQPLFTSPIELEDSSTEVAFNLQNALTQDVHMGGGSVVLTGDLALADGVQLRGGGTVVFNKHRLGLGGMFLGPWRGSLLFSNALDLTLNGSMDLRSTWTFDGVNVMNGNGSILDLSHGGSIVVTDGSSLDLNNIVVKGLGDGAGHGHLTLGSGAVVSSANTTFQLDKDFSMADGTLRVHGPTTMQLGQKNWSFSDPAGLAVDGTTLWLDYMDSPMLPGAVNAPESVLNPLNLASNLASGVLSLTNSGTVKSLVDAAATGLSTSALLLLSGSARGTVNLDSSITLHPNERIVINGDVFIDGGGSYIEFMDPTKSQLVMMPGSTLTLKNIELRNIKQSTLDLRVSPRATDNYSSAHIKIDSDVKWELDQDITFTNGYIDVLDSDNLINIFVMVGKNTRKKFYVAPLLDVFSGDTDPRLSFNIGHNTLQLENAEFRGVDHVDAVVDDIASSAISLSGNAAIDQDVPTNTVNLFVEGLSNDLMLRDSGYTVASNISFGDFPFNELNVSFSVTTTTQPVLNVDFDPGIFLFSANGVARLNFVNPHAQLNLRNSNAFIIDSNAAFNYENLLIGGFPIKQQASDYVIDGTKLEGAGIDASTTRSLSKVKRFKHVNALQMKRQAERDALEEARKRARNRPKAAPARPKTGLGGHGLAKDKARRYQARFRDMEDLLVEKDHADWLMRSPLMRSPVLYDTRLAFDTSASINFAQTVSGKVAPRVPYVDGNKFLAGSVVGSPAFGFTLDTNTAFEGLMEDGATLYVKKGDEVIFDNPHEGATHLLYAKGKGNKIQAAGTVILHGEAIALDENSDLIIELVGENAAVLFEGTFELPQGSRLVIAGTGAGGSAVLMDGAHFVMSAASDGDNRASFQILDGAEVVTESRDSIVFGVRFSGIGFVTIGSNAELTVVDNRLIFGVDNEQTDDFHLNIDRNNIRFNMESGSLLKVNNGTVSFRYLTSNIFNNGVIDLNLGVFAINARGAVNDETSRTDGVGATPGRFQAMEFGATGVMSIHDDSTLVLGENRWLTDNAQFQTFGWDGRNATFRLDADRTGRLELVRIAAGSNRSFTALIKDITDGDAVRLVVTDAQAQDLVLPLVSQVSGTGDAVVYKADANTMRVRTKDGKAVVTLASGATVTGSDGNGGVRGTLTRNVDGNVSTEQFTIDVDGNATPADAIQ